MLWYVWIICLFEVFWTSLLPKRNAAVWVSKVHVVLDENYTQLVVCFRGDMVFFVACVDFFSRVGGADGGGGGYKSATQQWWSRTTTVCSKFLIAKVDFGVCPPQLFDTTLVYIWYLVHIPVLKYLHMCVFSSFASIKVVHLTMTMLSKMHHALVIWEIVREFHWKLGVIRLRL